MAVRITDLCISCDACLEECPTSSIVDADDNPTGEDYYYVDPETCSECIGDNDSPACQASCPTEDCIVWDMPFNDENREHFTSSSLYKLPEEGLGSNQPYHEEISMEDRKSGEVESEIS
ncbi:MAG: 4Fe-4S ferredoxin [Sulfurimonas sp.]|nr:MAG: 4Fe-4S ferredoxin [Sulfurimonas sp.]